METNELKSIWQGLNNPGNDTWLMNVMQLNLHCIESIQMQKARTKLNALQTGKIIMILLGILWSGVLFFLVLNSLVWSKIFFVVSAGAIALASAVAVGVYIYHVVLISQINQSDSIVATQQKLAKLQSSTLQIVRILWLQMPFYCTWFITPQMMAASNAGWWAFTIGITGFFTVASIWLYRNISFKNMDKRWFRLLFSGIGWTYIVKAMEYTKEIEAFKNEKKQ